MSDTPPERPVEDARDSAESAADERPMDRWRMAVAIAVPVLIVAALLAVFVSRNDDPAAVGEDPLIQYCSTVIERDSIQLPDAARADADDVKDSVPVAAGRMVLLTERMLEVAPEEVRPDLRSQISAFRELVRSRDAAGFAEPKLLASLNKTGIADATTCSMQKVEFAASQFSYRDFPTELNSGRTSFVMQNESNQKHQMVLFRLQGESSGSFADVLERGKENDEAARVASGEADPDQKDVMAVELLGGEYALACFVKAGPEVHWMKGEIAEFSVR